MSIASHLMNLHQTSVENVGPFELMPQGKLFTALNMIAVLIPLEHRSSEESHELVHQQFNKGIIQ